MAAFRGRRRSRSTLASSQPNRWLKGHGLRAELLEDRRMLALVGVLPDFPLITYNSTGVLNYDAGTQKFDIEATPLTFQETSLSPTRTITNTPVPSFELHILVDNAGNVTGGAPGDDLRIFGNIDIDGDSVVDVSGTLLTGEVMQFGHQNGVGVVDYFDFRFKVTGGLLAGYFVGKDIAVFSRAETSTFTGSFATDFDGSGVKGSVGSIEALVPGIKIEKSVEHDRACVADIDGSGTVALFQPNATATYHYIVENTGNTILEFTLFQDTNDNGTPGDPSDDIIVVPTAILDAGFVKGDTNQDNKLDPGDKWEYKADVLLDTLGYHSNLVEVRAKSVDGNGQEVLNLAEAHDDDSLRVFVAKAGMTLEKRVNSDNANIPPFDHVLQGSQVNYSYFVTNTGNVILDLQNFIDDNGTPLDTSDDFTPIPVLSGGYNIGDVFNKGKFDPGESWEFEFLNVTLSTVGLHKNIVNVDGIPVNFNGITVIDPNCVPPTKASDEANIIVDPPLSSLSGYVWIDCNNNGIFDADEFGLGGVTVQLFVLSGGIYIPYAGNPDEATSNVPGSLGYYEFTDLPAGTYKIVEVQPPPPNTPPVIFDGKDATILVPAGVDQSVKNAMANIVLPQGVDYAGFNFGELLPSSIAGCVYVDVNNNGVKDPGETDIAGVKITLSGHDDLGAPVNIVKFSDMNGEFKFENLRPADAAGYTLTEEHPILFLDGKDSVGTAGGVASNPQPDLDTITQIDLLGCTDATGYCFGERGYKVPSKRPFVFTNGVWQNRTNPIDVNADGLITARDALAVLDTINMLGMGALPAGNGFNYFPDADGDSALTPADVLKVLDEVNRQGTGILSATSSSASSGGTVGAKTTISSKSTSSKGALLADVAFSELGADPTDTAATPRSTASTSTSHPGSTNAPAVTPRPLTGEELLSIALGYTHDEATEAADELYEAITAA